MPPHHCPPQSPNYVPIHQKLHCPGPKLYCSSIHLQQHILYSHTPSTRSFTTLFTLSSTIHLPSSPGHSSSLPWESTLHWLSTHSLSQLPFLLIYRLTPPTEAQLFLYCSRLLQTTLSCSIPFSSSSSDPPYFPPRILSGSLSSFLNPSC